MKYLLQTAPWMAFALLFTAGRPAWGIGRLVLTVGRVSTPRAELKDGRVALQLSAAGLALEARGASLRVFTRGVPVLRNLELSCTRLVTGNPVACRGGRFAAFAGAEGSITATLSASADLVNRTEELVASKLTLAGGLVRLTGTLRPDGWSITTDASRIDLATVARLAKPWFALPAGSTLAGHVDARVALTDRPELTAGFAIRSADLNFSNAAGTEVAQQVDLSARGTLVRGKKVLSAGLTLGGVRGQALAGPVYLDLAAHPFSLDMDLSRIGTGPVRLSRLELDQRGVIKARAQAVIGWRAHPLIERAQVRLIRLKFPGAYTTFMQMSLASTALSTLESSGEVSGRMDIVNNRVRHLDGNLHDIHLDEPQSHLFVSQANGAIHWAASSGASVGPSQLSWRSIGAYGLSGGPARLHFLAWGRNFALLGGNARLPVFNGAIIIHTLVGRSLGTAQTKLDFDADLTPISMPRLSKAFGWPIMNGELSGRIPLVRYRDHELTFDGDLVAHVFDGTITGSHIRLKDPLGLWPQLHADVRARRLDLNLVTRTFALGYITGRIDADIDGLRLFDWSPVAFDARLYTMPGDRSAHLISQKAVTRIADLGGGGSAVTAALESGFLRFFKTFHYRRIAIGCRLRNAVCQMSGAGPAPDGGYYLVQGSWIPRLDIIGNVRRVDWPRLLSQIAAEIHNAGGGMKVN